MKKFSRAKKRKANGGFSLVELSLVLSVIVVLIVLAFYLYRTYVAPDVWASDNFQKISTVMAQLQNAKQDNDGSYPAGSGNFGSIQLSNGTSLTAYISDPYIQQNWQYSCSQGTNSTLTITLPVPSGISINQTDAENQLISKINSGNSGGNTSGLQASLSGQDVQINLTNVPCN